MENNMHYRNVTLSTRVSAAQKAEYARLAAKYNVSVSEWALTLIEHHKNDYGTIGEPTPKEVKLERALELKNKEIQKLKAQRDTTDEYAANMQQRSNKAIHERDESNYALKQALVEVEKYKSHLKIAESLIGTERPSVNNKKSLITPISVGMTTILAVVIFGRKFN
jgi:predicted RNase H-like nuclease (RuvC/YqgF family)